MKCSKLTKVVTVFILALNANGLSADDNLKQIINSQQREIESLKEEVVKLKKVVGKNDLKTSKRLSSIKRMQALSSERFVVNGFMTAGFVKGEGDNYGYGTAEKRLDFDEDYNWKTDAVVGLQFNYRMADNLEAITQLIAKGAGEESFALDAEWSYIKYYVNDDLTLRAGRMRIPAFYFSESLEVGFTYPWVRPPLEVYINEVTNQDGVDLLYQFSTADIIHNIQAVWGVSSSNEFNSETYRLNYRASWQAWSAGIAVSMGEVDVESVIGTLKLKRLAYTNLHVAYDDGTIYSVAEYSELNAKSGPVAAFIAGYWLFGYRIEQLMPHITFAKKYTSEKNDDPLAPLVTSTNRGNYFGFDPTGKEANSSLTLGVKWDFAAKAALKLEATHYFDFEEVKGVTSNGVFFSSDAPTDSNDDVIIYSCVVDVVF